MHFSGKYLINSLITILFFTSINLFSQENDYKVKWDNGFKFKSENKHFELEFGGRIMNDWAFFSQGDSIQNHFGEIKSGTEFRKLRFYNSGEIFDNIKYKLQLDFTGGIIELKDAFIEINEIPFIDAIEIGQFKEPIRLDVVGSSKYLTFMERSFVSEFLPTRNTGFMIRNSVFENILNWQVGFFRTADDYGDNKNIDKAYNLTGRITGLAYRHKDRNHLLHLGFAYSYRKPDENIYKIDSRPESHLAPEYVSTGDISNVNNNQVYSSEAFLLLQSFSFQAEYINTTVLCGTNADSVKYSFSSYYAQASYFLTGESKNFKSSYSGLGRISPKNNFGNGDGGIGAWEIAFRYSNINLNDKTVNGGELTDITIGLNWYLNPVTRIMFNYIMADRNEIGKSKIFQMRFQVDF